MGIVASNDVFSIVRRIQPSEKSIEFLTHPTWRAYVSCYTAGYELCRRFVDGDPARFRTLLTEQLTTADLAAA